MMANIEQVHSMVISGKFGLLFTGQWHKFQNKAGHSFDLGVGVFRMSKIQIKVENLR